MRPQSINKYRMIDIGKKRLILIKLREKSK